MRLQIDVGTPLPEPPRDFRKYANSLLQDLVPSYRIALKVTGVEHRRSESQYYKNFAEKTNAPRIFVRVIKQTNPIDAPLKLNPKFSGLC